MSRRQEIQSGDGVALYFPNYGVLQVAKSSAPAGGEVGYAPGCEWYVPTSSTGVGSVYRNVGGNGIGSNATATWVEADNSSAGKFQLGNSLTSTGYFKSGGNLAFDAKAAAGTSPSATALDKIMFAMWIPAGALTRTGAGFLVSVWGTGGATNNSRVVKIVLGATNSTFPALPALDGTVTLTGGTALVTDTQTTGFNNVAGLVQAQLVSRGAGVQSSTGLVIHGTTHGGISAWTDQTFTDTNNLLLAITMSCATATTDLLYQGTEVTAFN